MPKKGGLGKGLEAIFGELDELEKDNKVVAISLELIDKNPFQPREDFDEKGVKELAESIKEKGIIQPIIVRENGDKYQIVVGERRFIAARMAGLKSIPAIVKDISDEESAEIALIENIQRKDLNPVEEALAYKRLIDNFGYTQEELAKKIGKDRATIANGLRLLNLPDDIKEKLKRGLISAGHARAILSLRDEADQKRLADEIIKRKLSVREAEKAAKTRIVIDIPEEIELLKEKFENMKVKITSKKLKLEFVFDNLDDLRDFANKISD